MRERAQSERSAFDSGGAHLARECSVGNRLDRPLQELLGLLLDLSRHGLAAADVHDLGPSSLSVRKALWHLCIAIRSLSLRGREVRHDDHASALLKRRPAALAVRTPVPVISVRGRRLWHVLELDDGCSRDARVQNAHDSECSHKATVLELRAWLLRDGSVAGEPRFESNGSENIPVVVRAQTRLARTPKTRRYLCAYRP